MATLEQIVNGTAAFIENEIFPVLSGNRLWGAAFGLGFVKSQATTIGQKLLESPYASLFEVVGVVDESGDINTAALINNAKTATRAHGKLDVTVPLLGTFYLGENDFAKLGEYIDKQSTT